MSRSYGALMGSGGGGGAMPAMPAMPTTPAELSVAAAATAMAESWQGQEDVVAQIVFTRVAQNGAEGLRGFSAFTRRHPLYKCFLCGFGYANYQNQAPEVDWIHHRTYGAYATSQLFQPRVEKAKTILEKMELWLGQCEQDRERLSYYGWRGQGTFSDINRQLTQWIRTRAYWHAQQQDPRLPVLVRILPVHAAGDSCSLQTNYTQFIADIGAIEAYYRSHPLSDTSPLTKAKLLAAMPFDRVRA